MATYNPDDKLRIIAPGPVGANVTVEFGGKVIPVYELDIHMAPDEFTTATLKVRVDELDVVALQEHSRIEVNVFEQREDQ